MVPRFLALWPLLASILACAASWSNIWNKLERGHDALSSPQFPDPLSGVGHIRPCRRALGREAVERFLIVGRLVVHERNQLDVAQVAFRLLDKFIFRAVSTHWLLYLSLLDFLIFFESPEWLLVPPMKPIAAMCFRFSLMDNPPRRAIAVLLFGLIAAKPRRAFACIGCFFIGLV